MNSQLQNADPELVPPWNMMQTTKAQAFLDELRAHLPSEKPVGAVDHTLFLKEGRAILGASDPTGRRTQELDELAKEIQDGKRRYWTSNDALVLRLAERIEDTLQELSLSIPQRPVIGVLETGRVNAMTIAVPASDEFIVIFESELFAFALLLSKIVARSMTYQDGVLRISINPEDVDQVISSNPMIIERFEQLMFAYLVIGRPRAVPQYWLEEPYSLWTEVLINCIEYFLMGHEYGHIIRGHFTRADTVKCVLGDNKIDELQYGWSQELEADTVGLVLMLQAMGVESGEVTLTYWGADLFFSMIDLVERGLSVLRTGDENNRPKTSHPPAYLRRQELRKGLELAHGDKSISALYLARQAERILENLWSIAKPTFMKLHYAGYRPAPSWQ